MRILFLGIVFLVGIRSVFGGIPVEHLNPSWLVFNDSYKTYVPYIPSGESPKVLYYSLKPVKFEYDTLQFMSDNGLCVYYNYRLIYQNTEKGGRLIKIPIQKLASIVVADSVLLAFYRLEGLNTARLDAQIITQGTKLTKSSLVGAEHLKILPRIENKWEATLLFTMLAVLLLLAFGKIIFPDGISFWKLLSSMSSGVGGALNGLLWVKIVINSICISTFAYFFLMTTWNEGSAILPIGVLAKNEVSYFSILWWTFLAHLFKFGYNYICANFSNMKHLLQFQNFMFVNLFYVFNLVLLSFFIICQVSPNLTYWLAEHSLQVTGLYFIIPIGMLIVNIIKQSGLRNVYLISYICTAELLPLALALKFLA